MDIITGRAPPPALSRVTALVCCLAPRLPPACPRLRAGSHSRGAGGTVTVPTPWTVTRVDRDPDATAGRGRP